jgi:hypothetical protein
MTRLLKRVLTRVLQISALLQIAAVLTLMGLALMVWSLIQPTPMPVILAMSVGQALGTLAFALFGYAVLLDQFRKQRARGAQGAGTASAAGDGSSSVVPPAFVGAAPPATLPEEAPRSPGAAPPATLPEEAPRSAGAARASTREAPP